MRKQLRRQQEAQAKAAKRRSESLEDAEARRQQDAQAKAAKRRSESLEESYIHCRVHTLQILYITSHQI